MEEALTEAGEGGLVRECDHPRMGRVPGREILLRATGHAAEHAGEAELTRKWLDAWQR
jgi:hypothetical protein